MSSLPPHSSQPHHSGAPARRSAQLDLARKWAALHEAADAIAVLAGGPAPELTPEMAALPHTVMTLVGTRRVMLEEGIGDLIAILEPGLKALLSIHARGTDAIGPAQALLGEFNAAREGLLALTQASGRPAGR